MLLNLSANNANLLTKVKPTIFQLTISVVKKANILKLQMVHVLLMLVPLKIVLMWKKLVVMIFVPSVIVVTT